MEVWDIYNREKQRTGRTMVRDDWRMKEGDYHLSVLGVIMRPDGKFLITRRAEDKSWAPGWWEVSGGAAVAGEDSRDAVVREIREETGLDVKEVFYSPIAVKIRETIILLMFTAFRLISSRRMWCCRKRRHPAL